MNYNHRRDVSSMGRLLQQLDREDVDAGTTNIRGFVLFKKKINDNCWVRRAKGTRNKGLFAMFGSSSEDDGWFLGDELLGGVGCGLFELLRQRRFHWDVECGSVESGYPPNPDEVGLQNPLVNRYDLSTRYGFSGGVDRKGSYAVRGSFVRLGRGVDYLVLVCVDGLWISFFDDDFKGPFLFESPDLLDDVVDYIEGKGAWPALPEGTTSGRIVVGCVLWFLSCFGVCRDWGVWCLWRFLRW